MTKPKRQPKISQKPRLEQGLFRQFIFASKTWWRRRLWHRIVCIFLALIIVWVGAAYGIARWYIAEHADEPLQIGATFIPEYAQFYGLNPQETLHAVLNDLGIRHLRLVSYWNTLEPEAGEYDFGPLDWQFKMAEQAGAKISLAIGLRQPRWPECHIPYWAAREPMDAWAPQLKTFTGKVIERYKSSPALESYQLENEFFMQVFGICPDFTRERLIDEFNFVKKADPFHKIIIARSNNWVGLPLYDPQPDEFGISVYKRVWDKTLTKRYFEYPLPAWFYAFLAGSTEIATGKDMIIHELQAEPWLPEGDFAMNDVKDLAEQNKSMNAERLKDRIEYARATGMRSVDLWGVEWWYWRKVKAGDPSVWNTGREEIQRLQNHQ